MKGDSSYQTQIVPMNNPNISSVETCYGILKHYFPSTPYHLPDKAFIRNEAMSNDKIKEAINTSIRKTNFRNTFGVSINYYLKKKEKPLKNVFWRLRRILHISLKNSRNKK